MYQLAFEFENDSKNIAIKSNITLWNINNKQDNKLVTFLNQWEISNTFGFDIETFSDSDWGKGKGGLDVEAGKIRTLQIAIPNQSQDLAQDLPKVLVKVLVIDLGWDEQTRTISHTELDKLGFWKVLAEKLAEPKCLTIGHSLEFEQAWMLKKYGLKIRGIRDTKLMSNVYWAGLDPWLANVNNKPHSLQSVALRLGLEVDKSEQTSDWGWGKGNGSLSNSQINYAAYDAEIVLEIYDLLEPKLTALGLWKSFLIECGASPGFAQMSHYGMPVNQVLLADVSAKYHAVYEDLINELGKTLPQALDYLFSPKKLTGIINQKFKLALNDSSAESLSEYWKIPEIRLISLIKTVKTYLDYLKSLTSKDDYVRPQYKQINRIGFGRSSASNPNTQNPPNPGNMPPELKKYNLPTIRSVFSPPEGFSLIVSDLSKAHSRIACEASKDKQMTERFNSESQDIFIGIVVEMAKTSKMGADWTESNINQWLKDKSHPNHAQAKLMRGIAKNVHYGNLNLQGAGTLQTTISTGAGIEISIEDAKAAIAAWKGAYPQVSQFQQELVRQANQKLPNVLGINEIRSKSKFGLGYVRSITGRGVFLPKYPPYQKMGNGGKNDNQLSVKGPDACAAFWTMAEADIIKLAIAFCVLVFDQHPEWLAHIACCCHDEIIAVCKSEFALNVAEVVQYQMEFCMQHYIKSIPVSENEPVAKLICASWSDK